MIRLTIYTIYVLLILLLTILVASYISATDTETLELTKTELSWQEASAKCENLQQGWALPSVLTLVGLYYFSNEIVWNPATDYWSKTQLFNRGFGLNTGLGILSFDVMQDQDHFICTRPETTGHY